MQSCCRSVILRLTLPLILTWGIVLSPTISWSGIQARDVVKSGTVELGLLGGYSHAFTQLGNASSSNRQALWLFPQIGYVFTDELLADSFLSGAFEVLLEPTAAHFFEPFSASLFGGSVLLKYNFLSYGRWMPFWEGGAGMAWTDLAPRIPEQSTQFEFLLQTGVGTQYFWYEAEKTVSALSLGVRLHHISNANIGDRNTGINSILGVVGVAFHFPD